MGREEILCLNCGWNWLQRSDYTGKYSRQCSKCGSYATMEAGKYHRMVQRVKDMNPLGRDFPIIDAIINFFIEEGLLGHSFQSKRIIIRRILEDARKI